MDEMPVKEISVAELCRRAGINRATFYRNYKDTEALIIEIEQEQLDMFRSVLQDADMTGYEFLERLLDSIDSAKELYQTEYGGGLSERFKNELISVAKEYGLQTWKDSLPKVDEQSAELSFDALLAGVLHAVLAMGNKVSNEKKSRLIMDMINAYVQSRA